MNEDGKRQCEGMNEEVGIDKVRGLMRRAIDKVRG